MVTYLGLAFHLGLDGVDDHGQIGIRAEYLVKTVNDALLVGLDKLLFLVDDKADQTVFVLVAGFAAVPDCLARTVKPRLVELGQNERPIAGWTHFEFGEPVVLFDIDGRVLEKHLASAVEDLELVPFGDDEVSLIVVHLWVVKCVHHCIINVDGS